MPRKIKRCIGFLIGFVLTHIACFWLLWLSNVPIERGVPLLFTGTTAIGIGVMVGGGIAELMEG